MRPSLLPSHRAGTALLVVATATASLAAASARAQSTVEPSDFVPQQVAVLGALDKITARQRELAIPVGTSDRFYGLIVMVRTCQRTTVSTSPQDAAFLQITDDGRYGRAQAKQASATPGASNADRSSATPSHLFSGWMFSSSPSLSAMEHPVYDIVLKGCRSRASQTATAPLPTRKHGAQSAAAPLPTTKPFLRARPVPQTARQEEETG